MISGDNPPKYCRWCGTRMPAPGMHEGSFKSETDCELEAVKSKLDEQVRLREMAESFLRTAIEINEKNTSRLDTIRSGLNGVLVRNQNAEASDGDSMSVLHELFYQWFQRKDVETSTPKSGLHEHVFKPNPLVVGELVCSCGHYVVDTRECE
jgi:hypothetical protein